MYDLAPPGRFFQVLGFACRLRCSIVAQGSVRSSEVVPGLLRRHRRDSTVFSAMYHVASP